MGVVPESILKDLNNQEKALYNEIYKKAENSPKKCLNPNCSNLVKKRSNHVIQKNNNILESLADTSKKLWILDNADHYKNNLDFFYKGINTILLGNMFCNSCDNFLFKKIESQEIQINSKLVYLYSLRAFLWEFRKNENHLKSIEFLKNSTLASKMTKYFQEKELRKMMLLDASNMYYKSIFNGDYNNIIYKVRIIPKIGVACSSSPGLILNHLEENGYIMHQYFFHIIPYKNKTIIIIATGSNNTKPKKEFIEMEEYINLFYNFEKMDEKAIKKSISKILLRYVEDWVCSEYFYKKYIEHRKKDIIKAVEWYVSGNHNPQIYELMGDLNSINLFKK